MNKIYIKENSNPIINAKIYNISLISTYANKPRDGNNSYPNSIDSVASLEFIGLIFLLVLLSIIVVACPEAANDSIVAVVVAITRRLLFAEVLLWLLPGQHHFPLCGNV